MQFFFQFPCPVSFLFNVVVLMFSPAFFCVDLITCYCCALSAIKRDNNKITKIKMKTKNIKIKVNSEY